jgi:hypothetical protein
MTEIARVTQTYVEVPASPQLARVTQAFFDIPGIGVTIAGRTLLRRWRSRIRHQGDLEYLPIADQQDLRKRVNAAIAALEGEPVTKTRAQAAKKTLLSADSAKRRSLLRLDFKVITDHLEVVLWALNAYEEQRKRRTREDEELMLILHAARERGFL